MRLMRLFWPAGLFFALAAALTIAIAFGDEPLQIEVTGAAVRVRDVIGAVSGSEIPKHQTALDAVFIDGLKPGEERVLSPADVAARLAELGLDAALSPKKTISVRRRSQVIPAADFIAAGEKALREMIGVGTPAGGAADGAAEVPMQQGDEVTMTAVMLPHSLLGPIGQVGFETAVRRPGLPCGLWVTEVTARSGDWSARTTIRYRVRIAATVLVTRRAVKRNQALTGADVSVEKREVDGLRGEPMRDAAELLGRRAARPVSAGTVVTVEWLEPAPAVRRAEVVIAMARVGGVSASTRVIALRDGGVGEVIPVRSQAEVFGSASASRYRSNEFEARVVAPGRVEVTAP